MVRALPYIIVGLIVYVVLFYLGTYQPQFMTTAILQVDVFGLTRLAADEKERLAKISQIANVSYEERQALVNRTVFMGCTSDMAKLALGEPKKIVERQLMNSDKTIARTSVYYIYIFPTDKRPTVLVFQDDKLVNAYKGKGADPDIEN